MRAEENLSQKNSRRLLFQPLFKKLLIYYFLQCRLVILHPAVGQQMWGVHTIGPTDLVIVRAADTEARNRSSGLQKQCSRLMIRLIGDSIHCALINCKISHCTAVIPYADWANLYYNYSK